MKRLIFTIIPLAAGLFVSAQTKKTDSTVVKQKSSSTNEAKAEINDYNRPGPHGTHGIPVIGNNRSILHWDNGQRATPTGHQAASIGGGYAALGNKSEKSSSNEYNRPGPHGTHGIPVIGNNRSILHWDNGQRATPTGHQAASIGGGYAALRYKTEKSSSNEYNRPGPHGTHGIPVIGNNRLILNWENGQRATPTGHQATGIGSGYSFSKKDK